MKRFWLLSGIIIVTTLVLVLPVRLDGDSVAVTKVLGMPVVGWGHMDRVCWVAFGGKGILVLGAGIGVVVYGVMGAGLLFACGQMAAGLIAFGQAAIGLVFVCTQVGAGLVALGQGVMGGFIAGQGGVGRDGTGFLKELNADFDDLLRFFPQERVDSDA